MLSKYERQREVREWLDLFPPTIPEHTTEMASGRSRPKAGLREIHLTPVAITPKLPRQIPNPKIVAIGRGVGAAVGVSIPRVVGPTGFGNKRGRDKAVETTPIQPTVGTEAPPKAVRPKSARRLGSPLKLVPLGKKKTVAAYVPVTPRS
ncbi:hypothetical protein CspeluHIS016_0305350 [Cutaneotrichosporon spelunceum]|uniref:Uncharacterized protein n=1 Tax=Cutaneotrichosporon spelunceum TaxID=1672016 RepID=A0AAD3TUH9_9TREE|nr:hypothetical protein CspeluHIS016_0305350 [Cutaneotrichosporon spelunceum]